MEAKAVVSLVVVASCASACALSQSRSQCTPSGRSIASALRQQTARAIPSIVVTAKVSGPTRIGCKSSIRYVRTPVIRCIRMKTANSTSMSSYDSRSGEYRQVTMSRHGRAREGIISQRPSGLLQRHDLIETAQFSLTGIRLCDLIAIGRVAPRMEPVHGHPCWRVSIPVPTTGVRECVIWVDPSIGFCQRRIAIRYIHTDQQVIEFKDYVQLRKGLWFPRREVLGPSLPGDKSRLGSMQVVVQDVHIARAPIPDQKLIVRFPKGTWVHCENGIRFVACR